MNCIHLSKNDHSHPDRNTSMDARSLGSTSSTPGYTLERMCDELAGIETQNLPDSLCGAKGSEDDLT